MATIDSIRERLTKATDSKKELATTRREINTQLNAAFKEQRIADKTVDRLENQITRFDDKISDVNAKIDNLKADLEEAKAKKAAPKPAANKKTKAAVKNRSKASTVDLDDEEEAEPVEDESADMDDRE